MIEGAEEEECVERGSVSIGTGPITRVPLGRNPPQVLSSVILPDRPSSQANEVVHVDLARYSSQAEPLIASG